MFRLFHPDLDVLAEFTAGRLTTRRQARIASHLRDCARCQSSLRFLRKVNASASSIPDMAPPSDLLARVLLARGAGERIVLPTVDVPRERRASRVQMGLAAATVLVVALAIARRPSELSAVAADSELQLTPSAPAAGAILHATYRPAPGRYSGAGTLVLRARLRAARDGMYASRVPASQVRAVATLRRRSDGRSYEGSFTLPSWAVFAALVVEDSAATEIDDHDGRLWEVLASNPDGTPTFDALNQRASDMMGRSWEEGFASATRLTQLYPDRISAWTLREFFEQSLHGESSRDSISAAYETRLAPLIELTKASDTIAYDDIGNIVFRAASKLRRRGATARDSANFDYWWSRILRDYPKHEQVAQQLAINLHGAPRAKLDSLEFLYNSLAPLHGPGFNLVNFALSAASESHNDTALLLWTKRGFAGSPDSSKRIAQAMSESALYRSQGVAALRRLLQLPADSLVPNRALTEDAGGLQRTAAAVRAKLLASLGRALVANGQRKAGLDTLALAARSAWDQQVFRDVASAAVEAGDLSLATDARVKLAVDPRTPPATVDSIVRQGSNYLGAAAWDSMTTAARREMYGRLLERSISRRLVGKPRLMTADRKVGSLSDLTGHVPAVVIFWSRYCGGALDALPAIVSVAQRLRAAGTPVVFVVDEAPGPDIEHFLASRKWTLPVYHDVDGAMTTAFANFGTPTYYVLDAEGDIRFNWADGEAELIAQVGAVANLN